MEELKKEVGEANTLNEIWAVLDRHYDLDTSLGYVTGKVVKNLLLKNFDTLVKGAGIKKKQNEDSNIV